MEYWVVIDGERRGPMSLDELKSLPDLKPDSYVWHVDLPDWVRAGDIAELWEDASDELQQSVSEPLMPTADEADDVAESAEESNYGENVNASACSQPSASTTWYDYPDMSKCPPTFLIFSIIMLLCCCQVFGIVAVVYSSQVRSLYLSRQYEKAERYSRNALIWCVISLFAGLLSVPLSILWGIFTA